MTNQRQVIREKVASILEAYMVGTGKPCQAVYPYQKERLKGVTPCCVVVSEPTEPDLAGQESPYNTFHIGVHNFTLYEDVGTGSVDNPQYSEQDSENDMDQMSEDVRLALRPYKDRTAEVNPEWEYADLIKSQIDSYTDLEGREFRHEYFPLVIQALEVE